MIPEQLHKFYLQKKNYIDTKLASLEKNVATLQNELMQLIMSDYIGKFDVKDGQLIVNQKNLRLAFELDNLMDKFSIKFQIPLLKKFGLDIVRLSEFSKDYYKSMDISNKQIKEIDEKMGFIFTRVGITKEGNIIKGSYLDSLNQNAEVRMELKDYVLNSVAISKKYDEFLKGFKELIVG